MYIHAKYKGIDIEEGSHWRLEIMLEKKHLPDVMAGNFISTSTEQHIRLPHPPWLLLIATCSEAA